MYSIFQYKLRDFTFHFLLIINIKEKKITQEWTELSTYIYK